MVLHLWCTPPCSGLCTGEIQRFPLPCFPFAQSWKSTTRGKRSPTWKSLGKPTPPAKLRLLCLWLKLIISLCQLAFSWEFLSSVSQEGSSVVTWNKDTESSLYANDLISCETSSETTHSRNGLQWWVEEKKTQEAAKEEICTEIAWRLCDSRPHWVCWRCLGQTIKPFHHLVSPNVRTFRAWETVFLGLREKSVVMPTMSSTSASITTSCLDPRTTNVPSKDNNCA